MTPYRQLKPPLTSNTVGITQYTRKGHIARATLEAMCYQTKAILDAMEKDCGHALFELAVDGGVSNSDLAMQVSARGPFSRSA
jgi:glycerol kinase